MSIDKVLKQYRGSDGCIYFYDVEKDMVRKICDIINPKTELPKSVYEEMLEDIKAYKKMGDALK